MTMEANGLVKLIEECGELIQISAKKIAFMDCDEHPDGKGSMQIRLEEELSDVLAAIALVIENFNLNDEFLMNRSRSKFELFQKWHNDPDV